MKKTLTMKLYTDVTDFNDEQIKAYSDFMKASFAPGGFKDISFEITQENEEDVLAKFLRSIRAEFKESDEAGIRIESQGEILQFPVKNDAPTEGSDGRPRD